MPHDPLTLREELAASESPARAIAALVITCLLVVLVPAMVALIGYRSIMLHGPSTAIVVAGDSSLDGAKIDVRELIEPRRQWSTSLTADNNWQSPILLDPGTYRVTVTHREKQLLSENVTPDHNNGVRIDLKSLVWIIGNPWLGNAQIEIQHVGGSAGSPRNIPITLNAENHFRHAEYLDMGEYRVIARDPKNLDHIVAQADFIVDRQSKVRVELGRTPSE